MIKKDLLFVGNILFKEYPSTMIYSFGENKDTYIVEWVDIDISLESSLDKYFIYKTSKDNLSKYFEKKISHRELILSCDNGTVVFFDGELEQPENIKMDDVNLIKEDYLPSQKSFFDKNDTDDLDEIISFFELNKNIGI